MKIHCDIVLVVGCWKVGHIPVAYFITLQRCSTQLSDTDLASKDLMLRSCCAKAADGNEQTFLIRVLHDGNEQVKSATGTLSPLPMSSTYNDNG